MDALGWLIVLLSAAGAWLMASGGDGGRLLDLVSEGDSRDRGPTRAGMRVVRRARQLGAATALGPAARRRRMQGRIRVVHALGALAAELQAGQVPSAAVRRCAGMPQVWPEAAAASATGGDIADALDRDAAQAPALRHLAACWRVAADSGGGLAASIDRLAASARVAEDVRVELEGQLAGPRATARTLAVLPIVGIGFGVMLGADPLAWLLGSTPGRLCLLTGISLTGVGMWWTGRIATSVERLL